LGGELRDGFGMQLGWEKQEMCIEFWWRYLLVNKEGDGRMILKWILEKEYGKCGLDSSGSG